MFLKTYDDLLKKHWLVLKGNDLYIYKNQSDKIHRLMHCLTGTFVSTLTEELEFDA